MWPAAFRASAPVVQFHWGGGTPHVSDPGANRGPVRIRPGRNSTFLPPEAEIGIEIDPRVTNPGASPKRFRGLGFNRLSMGIQDFHPEVQAAIKPHPALRTDARSLDGGTRPKIRQHQRGPHLRACRINRRARFQRHGRSDSGAAARPHRAFFSYGARAVAQEAARRVSPTHLPEGMEKFEIFRSGLMKFIEGGLSVHRHGSFRQARRTNWRPRSKQRTLHRNFMGYTTKAGADLYGMGVTAISAFENAYAQNQRELLNWQKAVEERGIATMRGYRLSDEDRLRARGNQSPVVPYTVVVKDEIAREFWHRLRSLLSRPNSANSKLRGRTAWFWLTARKCAPTWLGRIFIRKLGDDFLIPTWKDST